MLSIQKLLNFLGEGYEKTYEWALRLIKEYPNCNMLIWQTAVMLDIVCAEKDVEGTYKVVKHLLDNVSTMYDFRKSELYKHMKFRDIDEAILDSAKEKILEGFRDEEEFDYMAGDELWEKLIFDR